MSIGVLEDVLRPADTNELSEIIRSRSGSLHIQGGGTRPVGAVVEGQRLSTGGLSGISLYEPGALTIVAAAGTPLSDVQDALSGEGQRLPFEPMDHRSLLGTKGTPTIGAVAAANISGPRRIQAGACRDSMIGVRFVDGRGDLVKNGGRVMKNVTGYDLVKLMAGSHGTLGVLTEVAFKVLPSAESCAVVLLEGLDDHQAVAAMSQALGTPYEITGAAHIPVGLDGTPVTMLRVEGFGESVAYRSEQLRHALAGYGDAQVETDPDKTAAGWAWVRDVKAFSDLTGDVWRLSVKPSDAPGIVARSSATRVIYDWGGGLVWLLAAEGTDLRAELGAFSGYATLVRASTETRQSIQPFPPEPAAIATLSQELRRQFDPRGILNPGLMG